MSKTGRAAVYDAPNEPFVIRDYPVRDVHADEVLVKVTMSTICRSDIHSYQGHRPNPCPGILGHEIVGVIEQLGADMVHERQNWHPHATQGTYQTPRTTLSSSGRGRALAAVGITRSAGRAHHRGTALPWSVWLLNNDHLLLLRFARMTQAVWVTVRG